MKLFRIDRVFSTNLPADQTKALQSLVNRIKKEFSEGLDVTLLEKSATTLESISYSLTTFNIWGSWKFVEVLFNLVRLTFEVKNGRYHIKIRADFWWFYVFHCLILLIPLACVIVLNRKIENEFLFILGGAITLVSGGTFVISRIAMSNLIEMIRISISKEVFLYKTGIKPA